MFPSQAQLPAEVLDPQGQKLAVPSPASDLQQHTPSVWGSCDVRGDDFCQSIPGDMQGSGIQAVFLVLSTSWEYWRQARIPEGT